ncbi:hypothetical protein HGRIS_009514 [Hohenbuehelia grisea]|uniref:Gfd2/YDR514C-like C-terminal domain-containing protein n=1 Tax=Hohenbuehelia grisea TaxID=104357 RepID=A0ABR3J1D2_9AGAR
MKNTPIVTGYYRWTDIFYEWPGSLHPDDSSPLKALLAHDAITHPDHPLRKPSLPGVEFYLGTLSNGETRLMYSSAQMDYVRYWLHSMGYTKKMIPLPYSDCLMTSSELRFVSTIHYANGGELKKALKQIEKNNKRLKGSDTGLAMRRGMFERVRTLWQAKSGSWCAVDLEEWEMEHNLITEFGYSTLRWENGDEVTQTGHLIVKEHETYRNGKYVPDCRQNFGFGKSEILSKRDFRQRILDLISGLREKGPVYLVFHDHSQDLKALVDPNMKPNIEAPLKDMTHVLPDAPPESGLFIVDSSDLFGALEGEGNQRKSLERVCRVLQIQAEYLHNAGNDAHYTLLATKSMASGEHIDTQRERRWPNRTSASAAPGTSNLKVKFHGWEEDSECSDEEGLFPPMGEWDPVTGEIKLRAPAEDEGDTMVAEK